MYFLWGGGRKRTSYGLHTTSQFRAQGSTEIWNKYKCWCWRKVKAADIIFTLNSILIDCSEGKQQLTFTHYFSSLVWTVICIFWFSNLSIGYSQNSKTQFWEWMEAWAFKHNNNKWGNYVQANSWRTAWKLLANGQSYFHISWFS